MRKKAKYLHDAPNEALIPGAATTYKDTGITGSEPKRRTKSSSAVDLVQSPSLFLTSAVAYPSLSSSDTQAQLPQSLRSENTAFSVYDSQQAAGSPHFSPQRAPSMHNMLGHMQQSPPMSSSLDPQFSSSLIDSADPMLFNFDTASMNFGNHYGALEFGMLGHMSSGANETFVQGQHGSFDAANHGSTSIIDDIDDLSSYGLQRISSNPEWQLLQPGQSLSLPMNPFTTSLSTSEALRRASHQRPLAYAIGAGPSPSFSGTSPASTGSEMQTTYDSSFLDPAAFGQQPQQQISFLNTSSTHRRHPSQPQQYRSSKPSEAISKKLHQLPSGSMDPRKRLKTASAIYEAVTQPYPYTQGFHALTAMLQRRFTSQKRLAIAQALASIRPSFISCTRNLVDDDLLFMEKCFQRQLWEYQDFVNACGSPTIVCRRTGEVALVGKEFSLLTGWSKDVLLGKQPNLNSNQYASAGTSGVATGGSRSGFSTPRVVAGTVEPERTESGTTGITRPQAVFLAELLDDDSVVQFYEDFAKLAFADSKGSVWSPCKLLKYKPREENNLTTPFGPQTSNVEVNGRVKRTNGGTISSEEGMTKLGDEDGKVNCVYCWMVRRDVFDIPMMIVLNVSLVLCLVTRAIADPMDFTVLAGHLSCRRNVGSILKYGLV